MGLLDGEASRSVKLAGVKFELYHPSLPTLRRMDMDTVTHRLPTEHSRTTTNCKRDEFLSSRTTLLSGREPVHCRGILTNKTRDTLKNYELAAAGNTSSPHTVTWKRVMSTLHNPHSNSGVSGLVLRERYPSVTSSWQYFSRTMTTRPATCTPRPLPATIYNRYRTRPYTSVPWRP